MEWKVQRDTFVAGWYAPIKAPVSIEEQRAFWADLHNTVKRMPTNEHLLVLICAKMWTLEDEEAEDEGCTPSQSS